MQTCVSGNFTLAQTLVATTAYENANFLKLIGLTADGAPCNQGDNRADYEPVPVAGPAPPSLQLVQSDSPSPTVNGKTLVFQGPAYVSGQVVNVAGYR
ncbi:MAG TPA: hypothetical protein VEZ90_03350 [Blastocatellia bacterium]|nr:hypothetical protein [Blastocatellia bacterium]